MRRSSLLHTDKPWPATLVYYVLAIMVAVPFPPLVFVTLPLVATSRHRHKQRVRAEQARLIAIRQRQNERAFIAACRSLP